MRISDNITIDDNPNFGIYIKSIVFDIIRFVDIQMSSCLKIKPFTSKDCLITYKENNPMIFDIGNNQHVIFLHVKDNYWCKWMYQFAHEYCHHLIDGPMTGELDGCLWFEETLCETASIYNLIMLKNNWENSSESIKINYASSIGKYIDDLTTPETSNIDDIHFLDKSMLYQKNDLGTPDYNRDLYHRLAVSLILPKVISNPRNRIFRS